MPTLDRRQVLALAALATTAGSLATQRSQPSQFPSPKDAQPVQPPLPRGEFTWTPLAVPASRAGVSAFFAEGAGGNTLVLAAKGQGLLIDCKNPVFGDPLRREAAARLGDAKLTTVINTHHHMDHTGGNTAFTTPDITLIAHAKTAPRIAAQAKNAIARIKAFDAKPFEAHKQQHAAFIIEAADLHARADALTPRDFAPTRIIDADTDLTIGGVKYRLIHVGPGHTDNDLFVFFPDANLLHTGDLPFHGLHPVIDRSAGASTAGWITSATKILELCDEKTIVIPGHGPIANRDAVKTQIAYFQAARDLVQTALKACKPPHEIETLTIPNTDAYGGKERQRGVLTAICEELKAG